MWIFESIYYLGYSLKKQYSLKNQKQLPAKVISIGNITAGGTGKTPAVIALANEALSRGFIPCILTRGYKGRAKGPCFVSMGEGPLMDAMDAGDEPFLMANKLKGVPIVKCADRYKGGMFALQNLKDMETRRHGDTEIDSLTDSPIRRFTDSPIIFILDDGYQHWKLFRDKDILLIDAENPFANGKLIPLGLLREPLKEIKRANIIVITKADESQNIKLNILSDEIKQYNSKAMIFFSGHKPLRFIGNMGETMPLKWARNKNFFGFCGIGSPSSFKKTLVSTGCDLKGFRAYKDHYRYKQQDIENIVKKARKNNSEWIVTTEKDLTRLRGLDVPDNFVAVSIEFSIEKGFYDEALK